MISLCGGTLCDERRILPCPVCRARRRMVVTHASSPYYSPTVTCCTCANGFADGAMINSRPDRLAAKRIRAKLRERWAKALSPREARRVLAKAWDEYGELELRRSEG